MCAKGNPKFSCPTILSHSDNESLGSESDSREELFDSSLDTVNVSVNTELPMNSSHSSEEEEFDFLHLYEELSDYDFHRMMSVDDLHTQQHSVMRCLIMGNGIHMQAWKPVIS